MNRLAVAGRFTQTGIQPSSVGIRSCADAAGLSPFIRGCSTLRSYRLPLLVLPSSRTAPSTHATPGPGAATGRPECSRPSFMLPFRSSSLAVLCVVVGPLGACTAGQIERASSGDLDQADKTLRSEVETIVIWATEWTVAVWTAVPTVKMADQMRMDPRRPKRSEVNACASAPTNVLPGDHRHQQATPSRP